MEDKQKSEAFALLADIPHVISQSGRLSRPTRFEHQTIVAQTPHETKLALCCWFFERCTEHAREGGGNFRKLIYERLGFGVEAYAPLYLAGGLDVSTHFRFTDASEADQIVREHIAQAADRIKDREERNKLIAAMFRFEQLAEDASAWSVVIKQQRAELNGQAQYIADLALAIRSAAELIKSLGEQLVELRGETQLSEDICRQLARFASALALVQPAE